MCQEAGLLQPHLRTDPAKTQRSRVGECILQSHYRSRAMRLSGLRSFPLRPLVPPPPRLLPPSITCMYLVAWFFLVQRIAVTDASETTTTISPNETHSPHIVAQFSSIEGQRHGFYPLDPNATREGALRLNHLTIDPETGQLYVGAVNRLLQLDSNLNLEELVSTGTIDTIIHLQLSRG